MRERDARQREPHVPYYRQPVVLIWQGWAARGGGWKRAGESTHIQLLLSLREALAVDSVNQIHDRVYLREVVLPHLARNLVATEVKGAELDLRDRELLRSCGRRQGSRARRSVRGSGHGCRGEGEAGDRGSGGCSCLAGHALGCCVGLCCERRSSLSMCSSVVLPALSRPRKRILAFLLAKPGRRKRSSSVSGSSSSSTGALRRASPCSAAAHRGR